MTNRRSCCSAAGDVQCAMACVTTAGRRPVRLRPLTGWGLVHAQHLIAGVRGFENLAMFARHVEAPSKAIRAAASSKVRSMPWDGLSPKPLDQVIGSSNPCLPATPRRSQNSSGHLITLCAKASAVSSPSVIEVGTRVSSRTLSRGAYVTQLAVRSTGPCHSRGAQGEWPHRPRQGRRRPQRHRWTPDRSRRVRTESA
jgi:hypothetical protein